MKQFVKRAAALCLAFAACACFAACGGNDEPPVPAVQYRVTAQFDPAQGNVSLSSGLVAAGESVTVAVTANEGYETGAVTIEPEGGKAVSAQLDVEGSFTFVPSADTLVRADFTRKTAEAYTMSVSLSAFAGAHGSVRFVPEKELYAAGETVTAVPVPHEGYETGSVTANGIPLTLGEEGYPFEVEGDTLVSATFYPAAEGLPETETSFAVAFRGRWTRVGDGDPLYIGRNKMSLGESAVTSATANGEGGEQSYAFTLGGIAYSLSWYNFNYTVGYVLHLLDYTNGGSAYYVKDPLPAPAIEEHFFGEWKEDGGGRKLSVSENSFTFGGAEVETAVDLGYFETSADEFHGPIDSHMYAFFADGEPHLLGWYPDGSCPTVDARTYSEDVERPYTFSALFRGKWKSLDGKTELTVSESELLVNGTACPVQGNGEYAFSLTLSGTEYEASIYNASDYVLQLTSYLYDENGLISGMNFLYFLSEALPETAVDEALYGTYGGQNGADDVTVSSGGIFWGQDAAVVISGEKRDDGYVYTIAVRGAIYTLSYLNLWAGYGEEDEIPEDLPEWLFSLDGEAHYEFTV